MGKHYFIIFLLSGFLFGGIVSAQPTDLIFSEYIEGGSNDKCLEIYNGTGANINLSTYSVKIYFNGSASAGATIALPNVTLNNCDVYVICNTLSQAALLTIDDMSHGSLTFNGDDAIELVNGATTIDIIGNIGCDPGTEWSGVGNGTADEIIRRNANYCTNQSADDVGSCPWTSFTAANWSATGNVGDFSDLGSHTSTCASGCSVTNTITTGVIAGSPFTVDCTSPASVTVPFTSTGTFNAGNIYTAQLSDASGSFSFPLNIGTLSSTANSGNITASIPAGTPSGTLYRIRVISDNPAVTGSDNGVDITINGITAGTLIVNEMSNGASGAQEYMEFLVMGLPCESVSIQNLIFDDNNGDFGAATGVASGHYRFTTDPQWGCIPAGSLIVVYNDAERNTSLPADDLDDTSPNDSVYILPITSTLFEVCTTIPNTSGPTTTYSGCTYAAPTTWNPLGMANSGDCAQVRFSNGNYMHGIGYGGATGGPDNIDMTGGTGNNFYFDNSVDNDYTDVNNFSTGNAPADESPGAGNTAANIAFINTFRCNPLPVEWIDFNLINGEKQVFIEWTTATEVNSDYFTIERAGNNMVFLPLSKVNASGFSNIAVSYHSIDSNPLEDISYYRLKQTDRDGQIQYSQTKAIYRHSSESKPWYDGNLIHLDQCEEGTQVCIFDYSGKMLEKRMVLSNFIDLNQLPAGIYMIQIICNRSEYIFKASVIK